MCEHAKSKFNISSKLEKFKKCSVELSVFVIQVHTTHKIFFWSKIKYLLVSPENPFVENEKFILKLFYFASKKYFDVLYALV